MEKNELNIDELSKKLYKCYSQELCYPKTRKYWNENNKYYGMCAITSLIINDYFGGDICKIYVDNISHYFNLINGEIIDLTAKQFSNKIDYSNKKIINRTEILTSDTEKRYQILKDRLEKLNSSANRMFEYRIYQSVYYEMASGKKNIEFRLFNEKSEKIKIGDKIKFQVLDNDKYLIATVKNKYVFENIDDLWENNNIISYNVMNYTKEEFIYTLYEIFGKEKVQESKIVGIEFKID